jgi:hypothetical protein
VPFGYAVIFTDVEAPPPEIGIQPWEIVGRHGLNSGLPALLLKAVKHQRARHQIVCSPAEPQPALLRKIRDLLRPDFERVVARGTIIGDSERRLFEVDRGAIRSARSSCRQSPLPVRVTTEIGPRG